MYIILHAWAFQCVKLKGSAVELMAVMLEETDTKSSVLAKGIAVALDIPAMFSTIGDFHELVKDQKVVDKAKQGLFRAYHILVQILDSADCCGRLGAFFCMSELICIYLQVCFLIDKPPEMIENAYKFYDLMIMKEDEEDDHAKAKDILKEILDCDENDERLGVFCCMRLSAIMCFLQFLNFQIKSTKHMSSAKANPALLKSTTRTKTGKIFLLKLIFHMTQQ